MLLGFKLSIEYSKWCSHTIIFNNQISCCFFILYAKLRIQIWNSFSCISKLFLKSRNSLIWSSSYNCFSCSNCGSFYNNIISQQIVILYRWQLLETYIFCSFNTNFIRIIWLIYWLFAFVISIFNRNWLSKVSWTNYSWSWSLMERLLLILISIHTKCLFLGFLCCFIPISAWCSLSHILAGYSIFK